MIYRFIYTYLSDRTPRSKVNNTRSSHTVLLQNSIIGSLVFKIDTCDLFLWD